jgi:hypothetical protein
MRSTAGWLILLVLLGFLFGACNEDNAADDTVVDDSVSVTLRVDADEVFGFVQDAEIGHATFSDHDGLVGTRIKCEVFLDDYARFDNAVLDGTLELTNLNAIKDDSYLQEFTIDRDNNSFYFYIPQIKTVPIYLNFRLSLTYDEEFNVNTGTPATF